MNRGGSGSAKGSLYFELECDHGPLFVSLAKKQFRLEAEDCLSNSLLESPGTLRPILKLAAPVLAEELLNMLVGYTDWWLTGHFLQGPPYKAAMGLMAYVLWMIPSLFSGIAIGATAMISRAIGAGDLMLARRVMHQAFLVGAVVGIAATGLVAWGGSEFLAIMQLSPEATPLAQRYLTILIPIVPAIMIEQVAIACLRGAGDTVTGLVAKIIVNGVNVVLSTVLVIGWGPFPNLGWEGLAIGTAVGHAIGAVVLLIALAVGRAGLHLQISDLRPDFKLMRRLGRIGMPGGCDVLAVLGCHLMYVAVVNSLGTVASASHGLGLQIESLAYLSGAAFHVAAATMTGQLLGAHDKHRAAQAIRTACILAEVLMCGAGLVFFVAGESLAGFFSGAHDPETTAGAAMYLRIVAISMPALAMLQVLTGALRGAGDTVVPLAINFAGLLLIRVPGACFCAFEQVPIPGTSWIVPGLGFGVAGAWWAMVADVWIRSLLALGRFFHGGWNRVRV